MNNEMIGIAGVFALTFFLLVLRHCLASMGRARRSRHVNASRPRGHDESKKSEEDDSWLLGSSDNEAGSPNRVDELREPLRAPRDNERTLLRLITGR
ncbi:MAG: hypothetical protein AABN34_07165 [Acidobacteriota bacterium]